MNSPRRRFSAASTNSSQRSARLLSYRDFQSRNILLRNGDPISSIIKAAAKALCNTTSPRSYTMPRLISRPNSASSFSITISTASPVSFRSIGSQHAFESVHEGRGGGRALT